MPRLGRPAAQLDFVGRHYCSYQLNSPNDYAYTGVNCSLPLVGPSRIVLLNSLSPGRPISRVLSGAVIYLERRLPAASSGLPGARTGRAAPARSCLALLPVGVAWPPVSPRAPVVSYTTFSPSPARSPGPAVCFSVALFRRVTPPGRYPAPCPVEPGLSSPRVAGRDRLADLGTVVIITRPHCAVKESA